MSIPDVAYSIVSFRATVRSVSGSGPLCSHAIDRLLPALFPGEAGRHVAMHTLKEGRFLKLKDISTKAGASEYASAVSRLDEAPRGGPDLSLISWLKGHPFHAPSGDEIWVTIRRALDVEHAEYGLRVIVGRDKADLLPDIAADFCTSFEVLSGCAFAPGGYWPSWADHRWELPALAPPRVAGPTWLLIAPADANRLLTRSPTAIEWAKAVRPYSGGGAIWQLSTEYEGPQGEALDNWVQLMESLDLWSRPGVLQ